MTVEQVAAEPKTTVIQIQPADPQVVYVPPLQPDCRLRCLALPLPTRRYAYYPPGYVAATSLLSFGVGLAVGSALWGNCDWGHPGRRQRQREQLQQLQP